MELDAPTAASGAHAYPSSHDGGVDDEVHLLKNVTQDEWYCKLDDGSQGRAYRHVVYRL